MRPVSVFAVLALLPMLAAADEWNKQWTVPAHPELHVAAGDGSVSIRPGSGNQIQAHVETRGWKIAPGEVEIHEQLSGNRLDLSIREPHMHMSFGSHSLKIELTVPSEIVAEIRTGDGPVSIEGVHGKLDAATGDGSVHIADFAGPVSISTGDGPVTIDGRLRDLHLRTGDGSVHIHAASGSSLDQGWQISTGDGSVTLDLPSDLHANVNLHTGDGPLKLELPLTVEGAMQHHSVHGTLNGGGPEINVHTGDGSITLGRS